MRSYRLIEWSTAIRLLRSTETSEALVSFTRLSNVRKTEPLLQLDEMENRRWGAILICHHPDLTCYPRDLPRGRCRVVQRPVLHPMRLTTPGGVGSSLSHWNLFTRLSNVKKSHHILLSGAAENRG